MTTLLTPLIPHYESIYFRGTDLWPALDGKSVFVAGGSGFYGSWFSQFLCYLRDIKGVGLKVESGTRQTGWDICHPATYSDFQIGADYLINCVGSASPGLSQDELVHQHVVGPVNLANHRKLSAVMLQISSGAVSVNSKTMYAKIKATAEHHLRAMDVTHTLQIVRPFATVGPGMNLQGSFAISAFIRQALAGHPLEVTSVPMQRAFCHITDLLVQCFHVMLTGDGSPYDVGSNDLVLIESVARLISDNVTVVEKEFPTNAATDVYGADLTRVLSQFDLDVEMTSEQAVLSTFRYYSDQDAFLLNAVDTALMGL